MNRVLSKVIFAIVVAGAAVVAAPRVSFAQSPVSTLAANDDTELARTAHLATILRIALERSPDLAESQARTRAAEARRDAASRLPDLEAKYEQWGVPLARPVSLNHAEMLMLGVRQTFPAWGARESRAKVVSEEAVAARDTERTRRQDIAAQVQRTYVAYFKAAEEHRLHLEHAGLMSRIMELGKLNQRTGHGGLQDVLRLQVELTRVHADIARIEREERSGRLLLNALMNRPPDAPLGPPEDLAPSISGDVGVMEKQLDEKRPEVTSAASTVRRTEALLEERRRAARLPSLMVGLDYWHMPMGTDVRHAYGAMVAINLPWFSGRRRDEVKEVEHLLRADQHALLSTKTAVRYQLRDAALRLESARQSFTIVDQELLAQARRSLEAAQAAYAAGQGDASMLLDALRSHIQVRVERVRALAEVVSSLAELDRAAGTLALDGQGQGARR